MQNNRKSSFERTIARSSVVSNYDCIDDGVARIIFKDKEQIHQTLLTEDFISSDRMGAVPDHIPTLSIMDSTISN